MSVYIDGARNAFGRMKMCHMIADTNKELIEMAKTIRVDIKHIQKPNTIHEHFDICIAKRKLAVAAGAIELTSNELGKKLRQKRLESNRQ